MRFKRRLAEGIEVYTSLSILNVMTMTMASMQMSKKKKWSMIDSIESDVEHLDF